MTTCGTCGTCKHWRPDHVDADGPYGVCSRVPQHKEVRTITGEQGDYTYGHKDEKACTADGSGYWSAILCREDFGCVLWEAQP